MIKAKGQVVVIGLLLVSIFALIAGSVVTQSIFEQRKAVVEEKSNKAFYAAESGIEEAVRLLQNNQSGSTSFTLGNTQVSTTSQDIGGSQYFVPPVTLNSGEHIFLDLNNYSSTNTVRVCWTTQASVLILYYYYDNGSSYYTETRTYNSVNDPNKGFVNPTGIASGPGTNCTLNSAYYVDVDLSTIGSTPAPDFMAVWLYYTNGASIAFEGIPGSLPLQGNTITSTASINEIDGTITRSIQAFSSKRGYPPAELLLGFVANSFSFVGGKNW